MYSTRAFCKKRPEFGHCVSQRHNVITLWCNITSWRHVHGDGCLQTPVVYDYPFNCVLCFPGVLWSGALSAWIGYLTRWSVDPDLWTDCKPGYFLFYFCRHYSSALLCMMCIEKCYAMYFPLKAKSICTVKTAKLASLFTGLPFAAFDSQLLYFYRKNVGSDGMANCVFIPKSYKSTYFRMDSVFFCIVPFTIMILTNCAIIYLFIKAKLSSGSSTESTSQALSISATRGTAMLITVSLTFIILTGPVAIVYITTSSPSPMVDAVAVFLQYLNHSINGILYCIAGSKFRSEFVSALCCRHWNARRMRNIEFSISFSQNMTNSSSTSTTKVNSIPDLTLTQATQT